MLNVDIESLSKTECEDYIKAINTLISHMEGDRVKIAVDRLLDDGLDEDIQQSITKLNFSLAANGHLFDNDNEGFIPHLMKDMYNNRKIMKGSMIDAEKNVEAIKHEIKERGIEL